MPAPVLLGRGARTEVLAVPAASLPAGTVAPRRPVALKRARDPGDRNVSAALAREAALRSRLAHPGFITLHAVLEDRRARRRGGARTGALALAFEVADRGSLEQLVTARGPLTLAQLALVLAPVAAALAALHRAGVVHGDVSPSNLLYDRARGALLGDLGSALPVGSSGRGGAVQLTAAFAAPERLRGAPAEPRADVYALGATALALGGLSPPRRPAPRAGPGAGLAALLGRATHADPARRPADAGELVELLDAAR